jgi:hypothetical protein
MTNEKMTMHVINLERSKDRFDSMLKEWSDFFTIERFNAIDAKEAGLTAQKACKKSHYALIRQLAATPGDFHIIAEDDVFRTWRFNHEWPIIKDFLTTADWDIVSLDPLLQFANFDDTVALNSGANTGAKDLFQVPNFRSMGFIIYSKKCLEQIQEDTSDTEIDKIITHGPNFKKFTPKYLTVSQDRKPSIISPGVNYSGYYKNTETFLNKLRNKIPNK